MPILDLPDRIGMDVAIDTEASGLYVDSGARVSIVSLAWYEGDRIESRAFPFDHGVLDKEIPGFGASLFDDAPNLGPDEWDELVAWLGKQRLICFNLKYDLQIMRAGHRVWGRGVDLSNQVEWDGMVVNPIVWPGEPIALKSTFRRLYGDDETKLQRQLQSWLKKHKVNSEPRYDLAPWDLIEPYATDDAEKHLRLWTTQLQWIGEGEVMEPYSVIEREIDLAICLYRMECRGVGFDVEGSKQAAAKLRLAIAKLQREIAIEWGRPVTPDNARWYFYTKLGETAEYETDGGKPSVDKDAMADLVARGVPYAREYRLFAQWKRALDMYYDGWVALAGPDGRLRPSYHQTKQEGFQGKGGGRGTVSGRLSVERIQLQAIPHEYRHGDLPEGIPSVRSLFKARTGCQLWEIDISQAEVRVACHVTKCESMRQVLLAGDDVHGATAMQVFGVTDEDPAWSMWRTLAKRLTFATIYGAGPATFRQTLIEQAGIRESLSQCKAWLDEYRATFPEFRKFYYQAEGRAKNRGYVELVTGRRRWFSEFERNFHPYKAMNQVIQGNVADAMKIIKVEVEYAYPGILLNEIHDSMQLEIPVGEADTVVAGVSKLMTDTLSLHFGGWDADHPIPWKVDAKLWGS